MKLISQSENEYVFRLDGPEYDAFLAVLGLRAHLPRRSRSLTGDTVVDPRLSEAQADFDAALAEGRKELSDALECLLNDSDKISNRGKGKQVKLNVSDVQLVLQGLNDARVAAWESLGCPDFDQGEKPEVNDENFLGLWTIQATDIFQSFLLAILRGEVEES